MEPRSNLPPFANAFFANCLPCTAARTLSSTTIHPPLIIVTSIVLDGVSSTIVSGVVDGGNHIHGIRLKRPLDIVSSANTVAQSVNRSYNDVGLLLT